MTQDQVAAKSDGRLKRTEVVKIEGGLNKATSDKVRAGLAAAFGVDREAIAAYLDGRIELPEFLRRRAGTSDVQVVERQDRYPNRIEAAKFARASGMSEEPIGIVLSQDWDSKEDLTPMDWLKLIEAEAAKLKFARKDPQAVARERRADLDGQQAIDRELEEEEARREAALKARHERQKQGE